MAYHVINRGIGKQQLHFNDWDYLAFERVIHEALEKAVLSKWPVTKPGKLSSAVAAVESGDVPRLRRILKELDVNRRIQSTVFLEGNATLLIVASAELNPEMVSFLLDNGADPKLQNNDRYAAIHFAAASWGLSEEQLERSIEILKLLVVYEETLALKTRFTEHTPLDLATGCEPTQNTRILELKKIKVQLFSTGQAKRLDAVNSLRLPKTKGFSQ